MFSHSQRCAVGDILISWTISVNENHRTHRTFSMVRPKCLMRDFMNFITPIGRMTDESWKFFGYTGPCYNSTWQYNDFYSRKCISKCHLHNVIHLAQASNVLSMELKAEFGCLGYKDVVGPTSASCKSECVVGYAYKHHLLERGHA